MSIDLLRLVILNDFDMPQFARKRTVRIYLPMDYQAGERSYPVLYMHDGQNVFQEETAAYGISWKVAQTLDALQQKDKSKACIVVAIDSGQEFDGKCRYLEYSPWKMDANFALPGRLDLNPAELGGEGKQYINFIVENLKPYIDSRYPTKPQREHTFLAGSSMGGLISLYGGLTKPEIFGGIGVFSPAFWFNKDAVFTWIYSQSVSFPMKIYLDIGGQESSDSQRSDFSKQYLNDARAMQKQLTKFEQVELKYVEEPLHEHNEKAWAKRFPVFADWLL